MSTINDEFLYIYSGLVGEEEILEILKKSIDNSSLRNQTYSLIVNTVKNKEYINMGYSYGWVSNPKLYYALTGKNTDGTERCETIDDPEWEPVIYQGINNNTSSDWGSIAECEDKKKCPQIKRYLKPLIYVDENISIIPSVIEKKQRTTNALFSLNIPSFVTKEILVDIFGKYNKDKKSKINNNLKYPIIKITKNKKNLTKNNCKITFSHLYPLTSCYVLNMVKKTNITHEGNNYLLFFSNSK